MSISSKELARKLGLSPSSVSIALNGKPGISEATRSRILEAAKKHGLHASPRSRYEYSGTSSVMRLLIYRKHGLVFDDTAFFCEVLESINSSAAALGYGVNITYLYETENIAAQIDELMACDAAGFIIFATEMKEDDMRRFAAFTRPIVLLDNKFSSNKLNYVTIDNIQGAASATRYLAHCGHRQILHITTDSYANNLIERKYGACFELDTTDGCTLKTITVSSDPEDSYRDIASYFRSITSREADRPTAVFACSDIIAISCMRALATCGLSVPDDISVIGFDNIPLASMTTPPLTTVHVDKSRLGYYAVKRLDELCSGRDDGAVNMQLATELCIRESVKHDMRLRSFSGADLALE